MNEFSGNLAKIYPLLPKDIQESWKKDVIKWMFGSTVEALKEKPKLIPIEVPKISEPKRQKKRDSGPINLHGRSFPNQKKLAEVYGVTIPYISYRRYKQKLDWIDIFPNPPQPKTIIRKTDDNGENFVSL